MDRTDVSPPAAPEAPAIAYHGRLGEVWRLALVTTLLTVVTLGVYRFWAKARLRRYFWSRITVAGEPLEYAGTGLELFLGFLIALAILTPLYGALAVGQFALADTPALAGAMQSVPLLILLALIPVAVFRARRYRLSRTVWRGVRAGQTGSTWGYWRRAVGYGLLGWLSFWLLRPLAHARLTRHLMNQTWFGDVRFRFDVRARDLIWRWLLVYVLIVAAYGGMLAGLVVASKQAMAGLGADTDEWLGLSLFDGLRDAPEAMLFGAVWAVGLTLLAGAAYISYRLHMTRLFTRSTAFAGLRFASGVRFWKVVGVYLLAALMYAALLGLLTAAGAAAFGPRGSIAGILALGVFGGTLFAPFVTHPLLAHYVATLTVAGHVDLDAIVQNTATAPRVGEGLASVFDVDAM